MATAEALEREFATVFDRKQSVVLARAITDAYAELVKTSDFNELKAIVKDLASAQKRTEGRVEELATAQQRTERRLEELAVSQKEMSAAITLLANGLRDTNRRVGGIAQSLGYSLENEAYRALPTMLKTSHGITISKRFVRREIDGEEVNLFAEGERDGAPVLIVGEAKSQLRGSAFAQLKENIDVVRRRYPDSTIVPLLVTHFANEAAMERARRENIIVVQSYEW